MERRGTEEKMTERARERRKREEGEKDKRSKRRKKNAKKFAKKIWLKAFDQLTFLMFPLESLRSVTGEQVVDDDGERDDFEDEVDDDKDANFLQVLS